MDFAEYQEFTRKTAVYPLAFTGAWSYPLIGLVGEVGELAELLKREIRDGKDASPDELIRELGDALWYLARLADELDIELDEAAEINRGKLLSRKERGKLHGRGGDR